MHSLLDLDSHPVIGHRGASGLAPENTLPSFSLALDQKCDALEFDVRLSSDGVPVVFHDPVLERTTAGFGPLRAKTAADLALLDAGYRFTTDGRTYPWRDRGAGIPRLEEVLERFPGTPLLIEIKVVEAALPVKRLLQRYRAEGRTLLASFLDDALVPFRDGVFRTSASRRGISRLVVCSLLGLSAARLRDQVYAVPLRYKDRIPVPTRRFIAAARRAGCPVHVWTVNEPADASRLWRLGAGGMITNYPALIRAERDRQFPAPAPAPAP